LRRPKWKILLPHLPLHFGGLPCRCIEKVVERASRHETWDERKNGLSRRVPTFLKRTSKMPNQDCTRPLLQYSFEIVVVTTRNEIRHEGSWLVFFAAPHPFMIARVEHTLVRTYLRHSHILCIELAHFLLTYYSMDVAESLREQVVTETRLGDPLRAFDTLLGDLVTSLSMSANFHGIPMRGWLPSGLSTLRRRQPSLFKYRGFCRG
jgi:hypothetical protein